MRRFLLIGAVAVVTVGLITCVGPEPPVAACARLPSPPNGITPVTPNHSVLGITAPPDGSGPAVLARVDSLSLKPVSPQVSIPEYHDAWSMSPDGSQIALAISAPASEFGGREGRVGVLLVDLDAMKVVRGIETGIAAVALAWLAPRVLVAALQRGGTVLIDPVIGTITDRWPDFSFPDASARTKDSLVMLAGPVHDAIEGSAAARLAVVDARAGLRSVVLERIRLRVRVANGTEYRDRAGLAVDAGRGRAYVFAAGAPVAEVDLPTMRVSYHSPELGRDVRPQRDVLAQVRDALWLGDRQVLVFGRDLIQPGRDDAPPSGDPDDPPFVSTAAGASLVDTADWGSCVVDAEAGGAAFAPGGLLVYAAGARPGIGLRAYSIAGRRSFHLFNRDQVWNVHVADGRAYVQTVSALRVVDARTGEVLSTIVPSVLIADVIAVSS